MGYVKTDAGDGHVDGTQLFPGLETDVPLVVFAVDITDNPHYFDRGTIPGLRLLTNEGWHPAYESFCSRKEPYVITMENLCGIVGALPAGTQAGQAQSGTILQSGLTQMESVNQKISIIHS